MIKFDVVCIKNLEVTRELFLWRSQTLHQDWGASGLRTNLSQKDSLLFDEQCSWFERLEGDLVFNINMLDQIFWDANGFQAVVNQHVLHQDSVSASALIAGGNGFSPTSMFELYKSYQQEKTNCHKSLRHARMLTKITIILQTKNLHVLSRSFCPYNIHHTKPIKVCPFITSTSTFRANYIPSSPTDTTTRHASSTPAPGSGGSGLQTPPTASRAICQVSTGGLGKSSRVYLPEKVTWNQRKGEFLPRIIVQEVMWKNFGGVIYCIELNW